MIPELILLIAMQTAKPPAYIPVPAPMVFVVTVDDQDMIERWGADCNPDAERKPSDALRADQGAAY